MCRPQPQLHADEDADQEHREAPGAEGGDIRGKKARGGLGAKPPPPDHAPMDLALMPSSIAMLDIERSLCFTSFTVSALNSSENRLLVFFFFDILNSRRKPSFL